jgi:thiamine biosynthesis lipoprotein
MNKLKYLLTSTALVIALLVLSSCGTKAAERHLMDEPKVEEVFAMGTFIKVTYYDEGVTDVVKDALKLASEYDDKLTVNDGTEGNTHESEIDAINDAAGSKPVKVTKDVYALLKKAKAYSDDGTGFDMSIGALTKLWHIGFDDAKKPTQAEIDAVLPLLNIQDVVFDDKNQTVFLKDKGMQIDLGAIAKGYVADKIVAKLRAGGVTTAILDIGSSSLFMIGHSFRGDDVDWRVGVKDPNDAASKQIGIIQAANQSVSTSGVYERYLEVDGVKYPHILDPKTGYPFDNDVLSVTLVTKDGIDGDALSTTLFSLGVKKGYDFIKNRKDTEAVFVDRDKKVYITPGLEGKFELDKDSGYKMSEISALD